MIALDDVIKWGAVAVPVATGVVATVLFSLYRADYIRAGHPEPTLLAFRLTQSTLKSWATFRRGEKAPKEHARRGDPAPHKHQRKTDYGTVNRPIDGIDRLREAIDRRKTPAKPTRRIDE